MVPDLRACILALSFFALTACATVHVHRISDPPLFLKDKARGETRELPETTYKNYLFGLESFTDPVVLGAVCPYRWETVTMEVTAWQGILRVITLNLYSPWTVRVTCSERPADRGQDL